MQRIIFETEHSLFRDAFSAFLQREVVPHQDSVDRCVMEHNQKKLNPEGAAEAKLFTTELLGKVVDEGVQLHGGWGYMWEYPICKVSANARAFSGSSLVVRRS